MISKATTRYVRMSPQKARLVVDLIRGKNVNEALMTLKFTNKGATGEIEKVVKSAVANATQKSEHLDVDQLFIERCFINEGPRWKRIRPAPMGRAFRYQKRTSHIVVELAEHHRAAAGRIEAAAAEAAASKGVSGAVRKVRKTLAGKKKSPAKKHKK